MSKDKRKRKNYGDDKKHSRPTGFVLLSCLGGCGRKKKVAIRDGEEHSFICKECEKTYYSD